MGRQQHKILFGIASYCYITLTYDNKTEHLCAHLTIHKKNITQTKEKKRILQNLKINGCTLCGYNKCNEALDFHHVNSQDKKFSFNKIMGYTNREIVNELNKCILLCKNCHAEKHTKKLV